VWPRLDLTVDVGPELRGKALPLFLGQLRVLIDLVELGPGTGVAHVTDGRRQPPPELVDRVHLDQSEARDAVAETRQLILDLQSLRLGEPA
jgi:hypothetical protein